MALPALISAILFIRSAGDESSQARRLAVIPPFLQIGFRVNDGDNRYCALLADTDSARAEGMQGKSGLFGYDAMVFRFAEDTTTSFINHFVPIDLSIGWYDASGRLVDHTTMQKCPSGENCPTYAARRPFRYAVETPAGGLAALGLTSPGAVLHVGGGC